MSCFNAKLILAISSLCLILNEANLTVAQVNPWNKVCKTREINILQKRVFDLHVDVLWIKQHLQQRESAQECSANEFTCASGDCIDVRRKCDGRPDCRDQSDEAVCQLSCPLPFELIDGSCYFFSRIGKSWDDAQKDCMVSGANLVTLTSEQESQAVWNRFKRESTKQDQDPNVISTDSRCGPKYDNKECNATGYLPCCSYDAWCGFSYDHCNCTRCTNYKEVYGVQWIGLKRDSEGNFNKWVSGEKVNYTAWATHRDGVVEPTGNGKCVEMVSNSWNNVNCTMQTRYTCEKAATP